MLGRLTDFKHLLPLSVYISALLDEGHRSKSHDTLETLSRPRITLISFFILFFSPVLICMCPGILTSHSLSPSGPALVPSSLLHWCFWGPAGGFIGSSETNCSKQRAMVSCWVVWVRGTVLLGRCDGRGSAVLESSDSFSHGSFAADGII